MIAPAWFINWFERYYYLLTKINKVLPVISSRTDRDKLLPIPYLVPDGFVPSLT
jgi:hypothetical protein